MKITIIGAGNGGHAMAGHFAVLGHQITLYSRNLNKIESLVRYKEVNLKGELSGIGRIHKITDSIPEAIADAELIMICTTANAHKELASQMAPHIQETQMVVLNPGRTLGALEFYNEVLRVSNKKILVGEAQSLIYACRLESEASVNIIGIKEKVLFAAYPSENTTQIINKLNSVYDCFKPVANVLITSLENIGAILHPSVIIFNAATIERGTSFYFYNDMTPKIAQFLVNLDKERIALGEALNIHLLSVSDWVSYAYKDIDGESLCDKMRNNKAYYKIKAPEKIESRLLLEDIPTGILPLTELGKIAGLEMPLMNALLAMTSGLLDTNFRQSGRTLEALGIDKMNKEDFLRLF
jgi:opine dehydrogenase